MEQLGHLGLYKAHAVQESWSYTCITTEQISM